MLILLKSVIIFKLTINNMMMLKWPLVNMEVPVISTKNQSVNKMLHEFVNN